jgi:hypothetical protein
MSPIHTYLFLKTQIISWCWWLMPIILATQETEIGRLTVQGQARQKVHKTLIPTNKLDAVAHGHLSYARAKIKRTVLPGQP